MPNQTTRKGALFIKEGVGFLDDGEETEGHGKHFSGKAMIGGHDPAAQQDVLEHDAQQIPQEGKEAHCSYGLRIKEGLKVETYSAHGIESDYYAINVRNHNGDIYFDMRTPQQVYYDIELQNSCL